MKNQSRNWLVGQMVDVFVYIQAPAAWLTKPDYDWLVPGWDVPNKLLRDYVINHNPIDKTIPNPPVRPSSATTVKLGDIHDEKDMSGRSTLNGMRQSAIKFFWVTAAAAPSGAEDVTVGVHVNNINGHSYEVFTRFKVYEPTSTFELLTGAVGLYRDPETQEDALGLYATPSMNPRLKGGMTYYGKVELPQTFAAGPAGQWYITQRITSWNYAETLDHAYRVRLNGQPMLLDADVRYPLRDPSAGYAQAGDTVPTGSHEYAMVDSPHNLLVIGNSPMIWTRRDNDFDAHLMFIPPGADSRPVPLKHITFSWGAEAFYDLPTLRACSELPR